MYAKRWRVLERQSALASLMTIGVLGHGITLPSTLFIMVKNAEKITAGWDQASEISVLSQISTRGFATAGGTIKQLV